MTVEVPACLVIVSINCLVFILVWFPLYFYLRLIVEMNTAVRKVTEDLFN